MYNLFVSRLDSSSGNIESGHIADDSSAVYPAPEGFLIDSVRQAIKGSFKIQVGGQENMVL